MASDLATTLREQGFSEEAIASFVEAEDLPPPSARFQAKMDDQAATNAALNRDSSVHDRVMGMPYAEFEREYSDVLNANADDDDGTDAPYEPGPPVDSAAAYAAVDRRRRGHLWGLDDGETTS